MSTEPHGMGAIASPPDARDYDIRALLAADGIAAATPSNYVVPNVPPILDQTTTPECVAFSHSSMKAWHDRIDQGKFWNFDEHLFFRQIGGTADGAAARWALDRMKDYGYPVVTAGEAAKHKITAYYAVPKDIGIIKQAIMAYGPLTMLGPWYPSWINNVPYSGVLPPPSGSPGGHCVLAIGWDDAKGCLLFQNSWGLFWGVNGRAWMRYTYATSIMWEFWKAIDQAVQPPPSTGGLTEMAWIHMAQFFSEPEQKTIIASASSPTTLYKGPGRMGYPKHGTITANARRLAVGKVTIPSGALNAGIWWLFREGDGVGGFFAPNSRVRD